MHLRQICQQGDCEKISFQKLENDDLWTLTMEGKSPLNPDDLPPAMPLLSLLHFVASEVFKNPLNADGKNPASSPDNPPPNESCQLDIQAWNAMIHTMDQMDATNAASVFEYVMSIEDDYIREWGMAGMTEYYAEVAEDLEAAFAICRKIKKSEPRIYALSVVAVQHGMLDYFDEAMQMVLGFENPMDQVVLMMDFLGFCEKQGWKIQTDFILTCLGKMISDSETFEHKADIMAELASYYSKKNELEKAGECRKQAMEWVSCSEKSDSRESLMARFAKQHIWEGNFKEAFSINFEIEKPTRKIVVLEYMVKKMAEVHQIPLSEPENYYWFE
ncbi:hypothetical protein [Desulfobotulus mexicanus]|uniref:Tetratricopeptide repeat protein n=1 Tax=Desulfobotulus mexicanus TaxID=2586642 RepID=A0A5S5MER8_9BACT|nr:hypothetical protein [Desulfobotulus mexicanus]TYT74187.1 hypothetical protein FIM25_11425 [Desulfobotulus mexicanus]